MMEKSINPLSTVGMILLYIELGSAILLVCVILSHVVLSWVIILQDFYLCFVNVFRTILHFLCFTWNYCTKSKNCNVQVSTMKDYTYESVNNVMLFRGDVEIVMQKLGIFCDPNGDKLQERLGSVEISKLFDETEPSPEEVKEAFDLFDENGDGFIDAKELERVLGKLGFTELPEIECQRMIMAFDDNGDGMIDFREFVKVMEGSFC
ncbi:unnamed protein product [Ilex paraguariensis]|uniref:EF-hand domain-containing protein n=1 Tax=Ilex paraguariensis TaxID=185542 RepID=A0ABC8R3I2_9AQUA